MRRLLFIFFVVVSLTARADYLITNSVCSLKTDHSSASAMVQKLNEGDTLVLLSETQLDGYYHVSVYRTGAEGWVYRNRVRRFIGDLPSTDNGGGTVTGGNVEVRVVDVGAGLCNLIKLPGDKYIIYDAGRFGPSVLLQIKEFIPAGSVIELMVLSHTDADHIGAAAGIIRDYHVKKVLWTGYERSMVSTDQPTGVYTDFINELNSHSGIEKVNLHEMDSVITPGVKVKYGAVTVTFLCGFGEPLPEWTGSGNTLDKAEKLNGVSIVMKLEYAGNSILFCGDAVGRHRDDPATALIATEKFLVDKASQYLPSTIIIAPHHGASNGSSRAFVDKVQAKVVIFSAGGKMTFHHPTLRTAQEYLRYVTSDNIFRTDRGDDEGPLEWDYLRIPDCQDGYGDDDIHITLLPNKKYKVVYLKPDADCN